MLKRKPIIFKSCEFPNIPEPFGYIYLTTDIKHNKFYLGKKEKPFFIPTYFGSGVYVTRIAKSRPDTLKVKPLQWAGSKEDLNLLEKFWIKSLDAVDSEEFYNFLSGGDGGALTGDSLERMKHSCKGRVSPNKGKPMSESAKQNLKSKNLGGKNPRAKKLFQFSLEGDLVRVFESYYSIEFEGFTKNTVLACSRLNDQNEKNSYYLKDSYFSSNQNFVVKPNTFSYKVYSEQQKCTSFLGKSHSESSKNKMRERRKGQKLSEEIRQKISRSKKGKCTGNSNPNYNGKSVTKKQREVQSEFMKSVIKTDSRYINSRRQWFTTENSSGSKNNFAKPVVQLSLEGKYIKTFHYVSEVVKFGFPVVQYVTDCCKGRRTCYKGFKWAYASEFYKPIITTS